MCMYLYIYIHTHTNEQGHTGGHPPLAAQGADGAAPRSRARGVSYHVMLCCACCLVLCYTTEHYGNSIYVHSTLYYVSML